MSAQVGEPTLAAALVATLDRAAASGTLLVACDYDGTLAPIVDDPDRAAPLLGAIDALADLAALPATWVSLVSGRSLDALVALACPPRAIGLIGSHGAERVAPAGAADREVGHDPAGLPRPPHHEAAQLLKELVAEVGAEVALVPGSRIETKPVGVAFHYRLADPVAGARAADALIERLANRPGVHVRTGKMVAEFAVAGANKGEALKALIDQTEPDVTVFVGDDVTDEDGFAVLGDADIGIKVGSEVTAATHRVASPDEVLAVLARLIQHRSLRG